MKNPYLPKQDNRDTAAFSFSDFRPQLHEQRLYVAPMDVPARGTPEDQFKASLVLPLHVVMVLYKGTILQEKA